MKMLNTLFSLAGLHAEQTLERFLLVLIKIIVHITSYVDDLLYFIIPVRRGNQYHKISAAGLLCTEADLSCKATGG